MNSTVLKFVITLIIIQFGAVAKAQSSTIIGSVVSEGKGIEMVSIGILQTKYHTLTDKFGYFELKNLPPGKHVLRASAGGLETKEIEVNLESGKILSIEIKLNEVVKDYSEVIIKAISKTMLDKENPIALTTISQKLIDRSSESNIIDVLAKNTPGLNAVKTGPNVSKPFIRGLGYNRVLTLYDGIRQEGQQWGDEHGIEVDAYDIERVEVIKGPASLMYGTDALAGVVSLFPFKTSTNDGFHGRYLSEFQSNNKQIGNGLRLSYVKNKFSFALRSSWRISSNYQNAVDGKVYNTNFNEKNISTYFGFTDKNALVNVNFSLYDNLQGIPDGSRDSLTRQFTKQIYNAISDTLHLRPIVSEAELNSFSTAPIHQHIQHYRAYSKGEFKLKKGDFDYTLAFQQNRRQEFNHPQNVQQAGLSLRLNTYNYNFKYSLPIGNYVQSFFGLNGIYQTNENQSATNFTIPDYKLFDGGIFAYFKYKKDKLSICGGLRTDIRKVTFDDFYLQTDTLTGFDSHVQNSFDETLQFPAYSKLFNGLSTSLGLSYFFNDHLSLKANIGRGFRAPNITEIASNGLDPGAHLIYLGNRNFVPEFSLQEDLGLFINFKNFSAEISVFNNNVQNFIYLSLVADSNGNAILDPQNNRTYQYMQSKAQLYGIETWFSFHPIAFPQFRFNTSLALVYGINKETKFRDKGIQGEFLPLIPPLKSMSSISYKFAFEKSILRAISPTVEFEYNASQNRYLAVNNSETSTPSYSLVNLQLSFEFKYCKEKTLQLQTQVNNVFDVAYQSHLSRLKYFENYQQTPNNRSGIYSMGRNFCVKMIVPF